MEPSEVTRLLYQVGAGDKAAFEQLFPLVYKELRGLAASYMRRERPDHTLQPTALVHEAYMKLVGVQGIDWQNRAHFFAVAARQMRRILVDHARHAARFGAPMVKLEIDEAHSLPEKRDGDIVAVDEALTNLEKTDPRAAKVVELRFFGGLTDKETAHVMGISISMARRDWEFARAWLFQNLQSPTT